MRRPASGAEPGLRCLDSETEACRRPCANPRQIERCTVLWTEASRGDCMSPESKLMQRTGKCNSLREQEALRWPTCSNGNTPLIQCPDPAVVRGNIQPDRLQRRNVLQVERAAVQFLDIIACDRKPERDGLVGIGHIDRNQRVAHTVKAREHQYAKTLIAIP